MHIVTDRLTGSDRGLCFFHVENQQKHFELTFPSFASIHTLLQLCSCAAVTQLAHVRMCLLTTTCLALAPTCDERRRHAGGPRPRCTSWRERSVRAERREHTESEYSDERRSESARATVPLTDTRCTTALQAVGAAGSRGAHHYNHFAIGRCAICR